MARRILLVCFFLSGAAGLVYQVVWVRMLSLVFGNTVHAVSMVVAAFLAGLALGSYFWGKRADAVNQPLATYIRLEFGIAVAAVAITLGIAFIDDAILGLMSVDAIAAGGWQFLRFLLLFAILLLPTALMGATTPVMGKVYIDAFDKVGRGVSALYAANTYGAMTGAFTTGFVLIPLLTVRGALWFAVMLNLGVAVALYFSRHRLMNAPGRRAERKRARRGKASPAGPAAQALPADRRTVIPIGAGLVYIALSGFSVLAFEILWTRAFVASFTSTVYMFSNLLAVILLGMALGSHILSRHIDGVRDPLRIFGMAQLGVGLFGAVSVLFFLFADTLYQQLIDGVRMDWAKHVLATFVFMGGALLPAAVLMGAGYPLICRAATRSLDSVGRDVGMVYAVGTASGIAGSLVAAFVILPGIGVQNGLFLVSVVSLGVGASALMHSRALSVRRWTVAVPAVLAVAVMVGTGLSGANIAYGTSPQESVVFAEEDVMGTVKVTRAGREAPLRLWVNNYRLAASGDIAVRYGNIPLLLKPDAQEVLLISLGSGISAGAVGRHPVERIDCVEIVPGLRNVQPFFREDNHDIIADPRFRLVVWDGRHYVRATERKYDLVIADLFQPDSAGVGSLYSLEHFLQVKKKLKDGGAMAQWLPLYQLSPQSLKVIMRTFAEAFGNVTVWYGDLVSEMPALLLLGSKEPLTIRMDALAEALSRDGVRDDMVEHADPLSFLSSFIMDRRGVMAFTAGSPINTDNNAIVEYAAPRNRWGRGKYAVDNFKAFIGRRQQVTPLLANADKDPELPQKIATYYAGRTRILQGKVAHAFRRYGDEWQAFRNAAEYVPNDPVLGSAGLDLGYLYYYNGRYRVAATILEWTRDVNPGLREAHVYLADTYRKLGRQEAADEVMAAMTKALSRAPDLSVD